MKRIQWGVWISCLMVIGGIVFLWLSSERMATNLQAEMVENASLRMKVVELEEENKVFHEIFTCIEIQKYYISKELGLGKKKEENIRD